MKIKPRFVIDTNVLLVSISGKSQYHWIFQGLLNQEFEIAFTTEILSEYEEIIAAKYSPSVAQNVIRTLLVLPNAVQTVVYYNWCLLSDDDDNKFVDCAVAANVDAVSSRMINISNFNILATIPFPSVHVIDIQNLKDMLKLQGRK